MNFVGANCVIPSVYVRNLEERIKPEALKEALHAVFSEFGNVIDIVAKTNLKAKGQAFVVYDSPESALSAIEEAQGFELFDKPMHVALARTRSDATVKTTGNEEEFHTHKRRREAERYSALPLGSMSEPGINEGNLIDKKKALETAEEQKRLKRPLPGAPADPRAPKAARGAGLKATGPAPTAVVPDEYLPPNRILFVQNLPDDYDVEALTGIFSRFEGFREVRMVPGRRGIAFVEYEAESGAITAKENTAGMSLKNGGEDHEGNIPAPVDSSRLGCAKVETLVASVLLEFKGRQGRWVPSVYEKLDGLWLGSKCKLYIQLQPLCLVEVCPFSPKARICLIPKCKLVTPGPNSLPPRAAIQSFT